MSSAPLWQAEKGASMRHLADRLVKAERAAVGNGVGSRLRDALRKYDADSDGRIDINEFYDIFRAVMRAEPMEVDVRTVFEDFDRNRDGYLEVRELRNALAALGFEADRAAGTTTGAILRHFDADANGREDVVFVLGRTLCDASGPHLILETQRSWHSSTLTR